MTRRCFDSRAPLWTHPSLSSRFGHFFAYLHPCLATMKVFWHNETLLHNPPHEILSGRLVPYLESPDRVQTIKGALEQSDAFEIVPAEDNWPEDVKEHILAVHSKDYVDYLETIYDEWIAIGGDRVRRQILIHRCLKSH